jgi:hypothetical protein
MRSSARVLLAVALACTLLPLAARAQDDANGPTLAEQAARARDANPPALDQRVAGRVVDGVYRNEFLGFEVRPLPQWESMSRGQMNVQEAIGREAVGLKAGVDPQATGRVFGMHDGLGQSVFVSIKPVPSGPPPADLNARLEGAMKAQFPGIQFSREPVLLGDTSHRFDGFRAMYALHGQNIFQSFEYTLSPKGYMVSLVLTAPTAEKLTELLRQVQPRLVWIATPAPTPAPAPAPPK